MVDNPKLHLEILYIEKVYRKGNIELHVLLSPDCTPPTFADLYLVFAYE